LASGFSHLPAVSPAGRRQAPLRRTSRQPPASPAGARGRAGGSPGAGRQDGAWRGRGPRGARKV